MSGGLGNNYIFTDFFTFTPIDGCIIACSYKDTIGALLPQITIPDIVVTNFADPWQITASNTNIPGYLVQL